jgi:PAT family acetyl-CoA transporter-like MFS transporter 1
MCSDLGGQCVTERDGYYLVSGLCILLGALILLFFIRPTAHRLHGSS